MKPNQFAVIGLGQFGEAIARSLSIKGAAVMVIDSNEELINSMVDDVALAVSMDATDKKALIAQNVQDCDAVVVSIGDDFESMLLCATLLQELGVPRIIVRAKGKQRKTILMKMGLSEILSPEEEVGVIVAERLMNPGIESYLQLPDDYRVVEVLAHERIAGRTVADLNLSDNYNLSLISIKKEVVTQIEMVERKEYHIQGVPNSKTVIDKQDHLILFGKTKDIEKFIEINH